MKVTRPASFSSLDHGRDVVGVRMGTVGLGSEGADLWLRRLERRLLVPAAVEGALDADGVSLVTVTRGIARSDEMTSSAKSSKPGSELIIRLVGTAGTGTGFCVGTGNERIVRDEQGGKENVPVAQDDDGGDGVIGFGTDLRDELPEEDVEAGRTDDEDESPDDEPLGGLAWSSSAHVGRRGG